MATAGGLEIHIELAHKADAEPAAATASAQAPDFRASSADNPPLTHGSRAQGARVDVVPMERPRRQSSRLTATPFIAMAIVALLVAGVASALVRRNESPSTTLAMVQASATATEHTGTARVSFTMKGASGPLANGVTVDGGYDFDNRRAEMEIDPSKLGVSGVGRIEAIADYSSGLVMYMKFPAQIASKLGNKPWVKMDVGALMKDAGLDVNLGSLTQGQSNDPTQGLSMVRGADSVMPVGVEDVRGTPTTHYRVTVNIDKAIAEAPADQRSTLTQLASLYTVRTFPIDVWIDSSGRLDRYQQSIDPSTIHLPAGTPASANPFTTPITMTYELYDFGAPVDVSIPPADQVTDLNQLIHQSR
jgi:hypothetical protein